MPKHCGRNEDPVGKHAKAVRIAAVKADKAAKVACRKKKDTDADATKERLAEMEVDESFIQQQEKQQCIHLQSDMGVNRHNDLDDAEEEFSDLMDMDFSDDAEEADSEARPDDELDILKTHGAKVSFGQFNLSIKNV